MYTGTKQKMLGEKHIQTIITKSGQNTNVCVDAEGVQVLHYLIPHLFLSSLTHIPRTTASVIT